MAKTVFDVLKEKIDEDISSAKNFIAGGSAKDYSEYRELAGLVRGLETSKRYVEDLSRNYMEDDND